MTLKAENVMPRLRAAESWARGAFSQVAGQEPREPIPVSRYPAVAALQNQLNELEAPFGSPAAGAVVEMLPLTVPILARMVRAVPRGRARIAKRPRRDGAAATPQAHGPAQRADRQTRAKLRSVLKELDSLQASLQSRQAGVRSTARAVPLSLPFLAWPTRTLARHASNLASAVRQGTRAAPRTASGGVRGVLGSAVGALDRLWSPVMRGDGKVRAARRLQQGSTVLAGSVLLYSVVEQYRGKIETRAMYTPLIVSALTLGSAYGTDDRRPTTRHLRQAVALGAAGIGLLGTGFHIFNARHRLGHGTRPGLVVPATIGSVIAGLLSASAEWVRHTPPPTPQRLLGVPLRRGWLTRGGKPG